MFLKGKKKKERHTPRDRALKNTSGYDAKTQTDPKGVPHKLREIVLRNVIGINFLDMESNKARLNIPT